MGLFALAIVLFSFTGVLFSQQSRSAKEVDLLLLLALDVSASINNSEYQLMSQGLANALLTPELGDVVASGKHGAIAIGIMQWSGFQEQEVKVEWTKVSGAGDLVQLSNRVRQMPRRYKGGATDIGGAIKFSRDIVNSAPYTATRRVIDIAGDGTNNVNVSLTVNSGITINGLAIIGEAFVLSEYYQRFVIGGDAAFVIDARDFDSFETAMRKKLLREIGSQLLF